MRFLVYVTDLSVEASCRKFELSSMLLELEAGLCEVLLRFLSVLFPPALLSVICLLLLKRLWL